MAPPLIKLNTGASMPTVALGAWGGASQEDKDRAASWILAALQNGYRAVDTAWAYGTEKSTGKALRESGLPREDVWITTKLNFSHGAHVEKYFQESLDNLGVDYVDLYLMHWPVQLLYKEDGSMARDADGKVITVDSPTFNDVWADMEKIYKSGRAKAIGVSNFSIKTLEKLLQTAKVVPAVNQVELHPFLAQPELKAYCDEKGLRREGHRYKNVLEDPTIVALAEKYAVTPVQLVLAWHIARGVSVACKSENVERQKLNLQLPNLAPEDVQKVTALDRNERLCCYADKDGLVWGWTYDQLGW